MSQKHQHVITKTITKKGKIFVKSETDRISELPDDILSSIVSYFTVRDAANSSTLSTRWRHLCASISDLNFHLDSMFRTHKDCNIGRKRKMDICPQYKDRFVRGVNQFLQYYKGTQLVSFKVSFCLEKDSTCDIDQWVSFAIRMGVKCLVLALSCSNCSFYDRVWRPQGPLYTLCSELGAKDNVAKLQNLSLRSCVLGSGVINQLSGLISLCLAEVPLGSHEIESVVSCCLSLEYISLACCTLPLKLCISGSLHQLKFLGVCNCLGVEMIELSAANLTNFDYAGSLVTFSFSRVPNLKRIFFRALDGKGMQYVFSQLAKDLPLVENILVFSTTNWVQCLPECFTSFSNVKELKFFSPKKTKFDVVKMIAILKGFPLMEKLNLVIGSVYPEQGIRQLPMPPESVHKYLKEVHIGGFHFNTSYIEVATYMLEYAAELERMVIDPTLKFYFGSHSWAHYKRATWDEGERAKLMSAIDCGGVSTVDSQVKYLRSQDQWTKLAYLVPLF